MIATPISVRTPALLEHSVRAPLRRVVASAPMRVSFAGGGTDVPPFVPEVGGRVVGTAIDLRVRVVVEPFDRGWVRIDAPSLDRRLVRRRGEAPATDLAFRLMEAAIASTGVDDGVRIEVSTVVRPGAGLGGSASAAVAALCALRVAADDTPLPEDLAREATALERNGLRLVCGSQDQAFAAFGGTRDLRFDERGCVGNGSIAAPPALIERLGAGLLLVDSRIRRVSGEVLGRLDPEARRQTTAELVLAADDVARGFAEGSLEQVLAGMRRSAAAKVRRDPEGNAFAAGLTRRLEELGAEVVRVCGAGSGGHVVVWAPPERHAAILAEVGEKCVRKPAIDAAGVRLEDE